MQSNSLCDFPSGCTAKFSILLSLFRVPSSFFLLSSFIFDVCYSNGSFSSILHRWHSLKLRRKKLKEHKEIINGEAELPKVENDITRQKIYNDARFHSPIHSRLCSKQLPNNWCRLFDIIFVKQKPCTTRRFFVLITTFASAYLAKVNIF